MTDEPEAAVERVTAFLSHKGGNFLASINCDELRRSDLRTLLHALAEANERASLLRDTVRTRCAERDEARRLLLSAFVAGAEYMAASSGSPSDPATVAAGGRWMSDNRTVLNPQQEGSRDHGR